MELKNSILEKITRLYGLLSKIDKYWTKAEITKSIKAYNSMELDVRGKKACIHSKREHRFNEINCRTRLGLLTRRCRKISCFQRRGGCRMPNKLDKCYYWHIVTLAIMKNKIKMLRRKRNATA